jgi:ABC-2 type transport system permease protein
VAPRRVKEVLGVVGGLLGLGIWLLMQVLRRRVIGSEQVAGLTDTVKVAASYADHLVFKLLPSQLAADGALGLAGGRVGGWVVPVVGLAAIAGVLFVISIVLAERMYLTGWSRVAPGTGKARRRRTRMSVAGIFRWLPSVERSIVTSTVRLFLRSPQQIQPVATITVMMAVLPFVMGRSSSGPLMSPGLILRSFTALTFIGALHLSTSSTGIDGRSFWILLTAPCSAVRKLASKLLVSVIVFTALAVVIAIVFGATGLVTWRMLPKLIWLAVCMSCVGGSVGILLGIHYTDWEWEIPKRMLTMAGRFIMLAVMALFFIGVAITISGSGSVDSGPLAGTAGWTVLILIGAVAAAAAAGLLKVSARKLERMEWPI